MGVVSPTSEIFVSKGTLPENLPPVFTTLDIPAAFNDFGTAYAITNKTVGEVAVFSASKRTGQRRLFGVPHPAFIRDQGLFFEKNWAQLSTVIEKSNGSVSKPEFFDTGPRHVRITPHAELPGIRLQTFSRFKYCLITDVARCFPSIYTHSLPWAINGKAASKADQASNSAAIYGNRLDLILRQSQSRQTIGIAIGPDTSKVVAEILMAAVDAEFETRSGKNKPIYIRHVDDYWIAGNSIQECEKHLQNLRLALRTFELDINEGKTKIISAKFVFGEDWPSDFQNDVVECLQHWDIKERDVLSILSNLISKAAESGDDGIIRHVIRKIDENHLWSRKWPLLQHFLAQCAVQFPHSFDYVARVVAWRLRKFLDVDLALWKQIALDTIDDNAAFGRDSEVVWALWLLKELGVKLPKTSSDQILQNSGALTLCFLAHFSAKKRTTDKTIKQKLWNCVSGCPFSGPYWPLTLEMTHLGHENPAWALSPALAPLRKLHESRLSIIDWDARPKVFTGDGGDGLGNDPDAAIEDYGYDYGGFDDDDDNKDDDDTDEDAGDDFFDLI